MGNLQQFPTAIPLQEIFCARFVGNNLPISDAALGGVLLLHNINSTVGPLKKFLFRDRTFHFGGKLKSEYHFI